MRTRNPGQNDEIVVSSCQTEARNRRLARGAHTPARSAPFESRLDRVDPRISHQTTARGRALRGADPRDALCDAHRV